MNLPAIALLFVYYAALLLLTIYSFHRLHLIRLLRRAPALVDPAPPDRWPSLTVQLPLYNEPGVAARLIDSVSRLRYPGQLDIQVLDDSTDGTQAIVAMKVAELRKRGIRIEQVRRGSRLGFKAGALAHGLSLSRAELFAVFDADFVPPSDTLLRMVPHLLDAGVGMVQARWGHLNRDDSALTQAQAIFLDAHFAIESASRFAAGVFFNFNGTAGIWKRAAIDEAGGWSSATLTEDLDLSYRAQLAGWKFVFLGDVEVPGELPPTISAFQDQQHRWAKGSIQTARQILPAIARADLPASVKSEACFHLTGNAAYVATLILSLLIAPASVIRVTMGMGYLLAVDAMLFCLSTVLILNFYVEGQRALGRRSPTPRALIYVFLIGMGLAVRNSAAVAEGLVRGGGVFNRTPKRGTLSRFRADRKPRLPLSETAVITVLASAIAFLLFTHLYAAVPSLLLFISGNLYAVIALMMERRTSNAGL